MKYGLCAAAALTMLAGCLGTTEALLQQEGNPTAERIAAQGEALVWEGTAQVSRAYADTVQDSPFDTGPISVLTGEHGDLHTYTLTPCRAGASICGSRTGSLTRTPDYYVVSGAYRGLTFYLSPGGDGYADRNGATTPLAWN